MTAKPNNNNLEEIKLQTHTKPNNAKNNITLSNETNILT